MDDKGQEKKLKRATPHDMERLARSLEKFLPESAMIRNALLASKVYKGLFDVTETKIYYTDISSFVVATPVTSQHKVQTLCFFWDGSTMDDQTLVQLLTCIPDFDWKLPVFIYGAPQVLMQKVANLINSASLGEGFLRLHEETLTRYYSMTSMPKVLVSLPDGYDLRPLQEKHADHMLAHWYYDGGETKQGYRHMVATTPGYGVFQCKAQSGKNDEAIKRVASSGKEITSVTESDSQANAASKAGTPIDTSTKGGDRHLEKPVKTEENFFKSKATSSSDTDTNKSSDSQGDTADLPVAWSQLHILNYLTNTFTLPQHRRQGLAKAVTVALAKRSLENTGVAATCIVVDNEASKAMHKKLGFIEQHEIGYQYYLSSHPEAGPYIERV